MKQNASSKMTVKPVNAGKFEGCFLLENDVGNTYWCCFTSEAHARVVAARLNPALCKEGYPLARMSEGQMPITAGGAAITLKDLDL